MIYFVTLKHEAQRVSIEANTVVQAAWIYDNYYRDPLKEEDYIVKVRQFRKKIVYEIKISKVRKIVKSVGFVEAK